MDPTSFKTNLSSWEIIIDLNQEQQKFSARDYNSIFSMTTGNINKRVYVIIINKYFSVGCVISDQSSFIVTGGLTSSRFLDNVVRYNMMVRVQYFLIVAFHLIAC